MYRRVTGFLPRRDGRSPAPGHQPTCQRRTCRRRSSSGTSRRRPRGRRETLSGAAGPRTTCNRGHGGATNGASSDRGGDPWVGRSELRGRRRRDGERVRARHVGGVRVHQWDAGRRRCAQRTAMATAPACAAAGPAPQARPAPADPSSPAPQARAAPAESGAGGVAGSSGAGGGSGASGAGGGSGASGAAGTSGTTGAGGRGGAGGATGTGGGVAGASGAAGTGGRGGAGGSAGSGVAGASGTTGGGVAGASGAGRHRRPRWRGRFRRQRRCRRKRDHGWWCGGRERHDRRRRPRRRCGHDQHRRERGHDRRRWNGRRNRNLPWRRHLLRRLRGRSPGHVDAGGLDALGWNHHRLVGQHRRHTRLHSAGVDVFDVAIPGGDRPRFPPPPWSGPTTVAATVTRWQNGTGAPAALLCVRWRDPGNNYCVALDPISASSSRRGRAASPTAARSSRRRSQSGPGSASNCPWIRRGRSRQARRDRVRYLRNDGCRPQRFDRDRDPQHHGEVRQHRGDAAMRHWPSAALCLVLVSG